MFFVATTDANAKFLVICSSFKKDFPPCLCSNKILHPVINSDNSFSSIDAWISGPFLLFLSTKCFSIIFAPRDKAIIEDNKSPVWSDKPIIVLGKIFFSWIMLFNLKRLSEVG